MKLCCRIYSHTEAFSDLREVKSFQGESCVGNMVWLEPCVCQEGSGAKVWSCLFLQLILTTTCCDRVAQSIHTYKHSQTHLQTAATAAVSKKEKSSVCFYHAGIHLYTAAVFSSCLLLRHAKFNGGRYFSPVVYSVTLYNMVTLTCINSCLTNAQIVMS